MVFLRNRLKYALTYDECKKILNQRLVKVDGKVRTDNTYPAGFMGESQCPFTPVQFGGLLNAMRFSFLIEVNTTVKWIRSGVKRDNGKRSITL